VADRVFLLRLSPPQYVGEFFGLYGLVGKASQVLGQALYGVLVFTLIDTLGKGAYQVAILSLLVTMLIGYWLVRPVDDHWSESGSAEPETEEPEVAWGRQPGLVPEAVAVVDEGPFAPRV
jgi:MFS-type transporter involved in bile tolerance (Atg22 family)